MAKYVVDVLQSRWAYSPVEVEAEDEDAARNIVEQMLADDEKVDAMFEEVDFNDFGWVNAETRISWVTPAEGLEPVMSDIDKDS